MRRRWIGMLLTVMVLSGLPVPALAAEGLEVPPAAEVLEKAPQAEGTPAEEVMIEEPVTVEAPAEEEVPDTEGGTVTDAPEATPEPEGFTDVPESAWYAEAVMSAYEKGIVKGVTDHTFDPNGATTRGQTVTMLYRAMGSPTASAVFSDTSGEVASAAGWASAQGIVNGISAASFAPGSYISRQQLVAMLYRMAGSPAVSNVSDIYMYTDGSLVQSYARSAMAWALGSGLVNGYGDGSLRPTGAATRAEVCALIMRCAGV